MLLVQAVVVEVLEHMFEVVVEELGLVVVVLVHMFVVEEQEHMLEELVQAVVAVVEEVVLDLNNHFYSCTGHCQIQG